MQLDVFGARLAVSQQVDCARLHLFRVGKILPHRFLRGYDEAFPVELKRPFVSTNDVIDRRVVCHGRNQRHRWPSRVVQEHVKGVWNLSNAVAEVPFTSCTNAVFGKVQSYSIEDPSDAMNEESGGDAAGVVPVAAPLEIAVRIPWPFGSRPEPCVPVEIHARLGVWIEVVGPEITHIIP